MQMEYSNILMSPLHRKRDTENSHKRNHMVFRNNTFFLNEWRFNNYQINKFSLFTLLLQGYPIILNC